MRVDIYDSPGSGSADYQAALDKQCASLGIQLDCGTPQPGKPATLTVVFANAKSKWTDPQKQSLKQLVGASALVLPIIDSGPDAVHLPPEIGAINAFKKGDTGKAWADSLVDETLSMTWLKRRTRKVFVSYRRIDSEPIARQIFSRFNELGYEVFLDDASIDRGVNFQQELKWWLNDADMVLALCSPRFSGSEWCMEELTFAQRHLIGIVGLAWPRQLYEEGNKLPFDGQTSLKEPDALGRIMEDQKMVLDFTDFAGAAVAAVPDPQLQKRELAPDALERLVGFCARHRAASIRARLDNLLPLAKDTLAVDGAINIKQAFGDLTYEDGQGRQCFLRVLPFRPHPDHIYDAYSSGGAVHLAACAYDECDLTDRRAKALLWFADKNGISGGGAVNAAIWAICGGEVL